MSNRTVFTAKKFDMYRIAYIAAGFTAQWERLSFTGNREICFYKKSTCTTVVLSLA